MAGIAVTENYVGQRIYIHDTYGNDIASTTVLDQYKDIMTIIVPGRYADNLKNEFVSVLILTPDSVHEFGGRIQNSVFNSNCSEIALFRGRIRKDCRHAPRYSVKTVASVPHLVINSRRERMLNSLEVNIVNLSISGALLSTKQNTFSHAAIFEMVFEVDGQNTIMYAKIVREKNINDGNTEYGCRFVLPKFIE